MRFRVLIASLGVALAAGCAGENGPEQADQAWDALLAKRPGDAVSGIERQRWTDQLRQFVEDHPDHREAITLYDQIELEHALQLMANNRYEEARAHLESLLGRTPDNGAAAEALARVEKMINRTAETFEGLQLGMSPDQVRERVGLPRPGWRRVDGSTEEWLYRMSGGRVVLLRFENERLVAVELGDSRE